MSESEPAVPEAPAPSSEPTANGSNGPALPTAAVAPPAAEPVFVPPLDDEPAPPALAPPELPAPIPLQAGVETLEDRLRRLEAMLSKLADKPADERTSKTAGAPVAAVASAPVAAVAAAPLATAVSPVATVADPAGPSRTAQLLDAGRRWLPLARSWAAPAADGRADLRPSWLFADILREAQSILHMYGDPRYRLTWSGRVFPLLFLILIATSNIWLKPLVWWIPDSLGFIATLFIKGIDLLLAFFMFKVLTREARRYRDLIQPYPQPPQ